MLYEVITRQQGVEQALRDAEIEIDPALTVKRNIGDEIRGMQKSVTKRVRMEPISARIWVAKGDSPNNIPAKKAPRAGDKFSE